MRRARTGSMEAARRAGMMPATAAVITSTPMAMPMTGTLTLVISKSCDLTYRTQKTAVKAPFLYTLWWESIHNELDAGSVLDLPLSRTCLR
jgi:hypothetical protein